MSIESSELSYLAYEYVQLNDKADRARKLMVEAKASAELAECRANTAAGKLRDLTVKSPIELPITIAILESDRLLTICDHDFIDFIVTTNPNPQ